MQKKERSFKKIPPHIQRNLLDQRTLELWSPYSLLERAQLVRNTWELDISHQTLWLFYRQNNVKFKTGISVYRKERTRSAEIRGKRIVFAQLLANLIRQGSPIIYTDETTYTTWMLKAKSWSMEGRPILHARNNLRKAVTVYGAIGNCLDKSVFTLGTSTNGNEFRQFCLEVKAAVKT